MAERKGGRGVTDRAVSEFQTCKWCDFKFPVVWSMSSRRIKHVCAPSQFQTKNSEIWGGWRGHLSPVPRLWGWSVCPPSSIPLILPLQIPCSLVVTKLIRNSCAPPLPRQDSEKLKRVPVPRLLPRWAYVIGGWGEWKSTKYRETYAQFYLDVDLIVFLAFILFFKF